MKQHLILPLAVLLLLAMAPAGAPAEEAVPADETPAENPTDPSVLLEELKAALLTPESAADLVAELGPQINTAEAARLILYAASTHGQRFPPLFKACGEALRRMAAPEVLDFLLNARQDPRVTAKGLELAYEALGDCKIDSAADGEGFARRRQSLVEGLRNSTPSVVMSSARALGKTGDPEAVGALVDRMQVVGSETGAVIGNALTALTGRSETTPTAWKNWRQANPGRAAAPQGTQAAPASAPPSISRGKEAAGVSPPPPRGGAVEIPSEAPPPPAQAASAKEDSNLEEWEYDYYGIPVKSTKMSFVIDVSDSMGPEENPAPSSFPRAAPGVNSPDRWVETEARFSSKCKLAKYELITTILQMPGNARFNIVFFGGKETWVWPQEGHLIEGNDSNKNKAIDRIIAQHLHWGTPLIEGLEASWKNREIDTIFLLSDGRPFNSRVMAPSEVVSIATRACAGSRKITINAVNMNALPYFYKGRWKTEPENGICTNLANATGGQVKVLAAPSAPFTARTKIYRR